MIRPGLHRIAIPKVVAAIFFALMMLAAVAASQTANLVIQTGHSDSINAIAFNFDGSLLATGADDNTIKIWDVETGSEIRTLAGNLTRVRQVAFSPVRNLLASAGDGDRIIMWDVVGGRPIWSYTGGGQSLAFSPDGRVLSAGVGRFVIFFDVATGKVLRKTQHGETAGVSTLAYSLNGRLVASGSYDGTIDIWNSTNGHLLRSIEVKGHSTMVKEVAFSPDGKTLYSIGWDDVVHVWDVRSGAEMEQLARGSSNIDGLAISPDGKSVATAHSQPPDTSSPSEPVRISSPDGRQSLAVKNDGTEIYALAFSPDGKTLAGGGRGRKIYFWDPESGATIKTIAPHSFGVGSVSFSRDGQFLVTANGDRSIKIWPFESLTDFKSFQGNSELATSIALSSDNQTVSIGGRKDNGFEIELWDVSTSEMRTLSPGEYGTVRTIALSPDGKKISGTSFSNIYLWSADGSQKIKLSGHESEVIISAFSPDSSLLASGSTDNTAAIWDVRTGTRLRRLVGHSSWVECLAFSPDGRTLATGSEVSDGTIRFWDVETGLEKEQARISTGAWVHSVAFSPDGKTLASAGGDNKVKLWDMDGRQLAELSGHKSSVTSVAFSPSGKILASSSLDGSVILWDLAKRRQICSLIALNATDWAVVTTDGRFDTNLDLANIDGLHWVVSDDPLKPVPLDLFVRDYYEPKLLPRLLACTEQGHCEQELRPLPSISELNRVQPRVRILNVSAPDERRRVRVTVEAAGGAPLSKTCKIKRCETGVFDLGLFRDGRLVGNYPNRSRPGSDNPRSSVVSIDDKKTWRTATRIPLDRTSGCTNGAEECARAEFTVQLPFAKDVGDIAFSAYAFNEDRVKSKTAVWNGNDWGAQLRQRLPKAKYVRPRAYIISVGVNATNTGAWNLDLAVNDAEQMQRVLSKSLEGKFDIVPVKLVSDFDQPDHPGTKNATKAVIRTVFDILSDKPLSEGQKRAVPNSQQLKKVSPDDAVFISFSSHGYLDKRGMFYLLPADTAKAQGSQKLPDTASMISSDELAGWVRDIDAGEMVMIIDTCYAEALVTGTGFKPAPIGSRGLGQMGYDKQMRILTATRQKDEAIEVRKGINQGLLTAALIQGLDNGLADFKPKPDGKIFLGEWLDFATTYVPKLFEQVLKGEKKGFVESKSAGYKKTQGAFLQTPVLFDLRRDRSHDIELAVKPGN